jgi:SAM-dependent methyltransferase
MGYMVPENTGFPLRLGTPEEFARVGEFFKRSGFDDKTTCRAFGIEEMSDLGQVNWEKVSLEGVSAALRWCITVFLRGLRADETESRRICGDEALRALVALGLLRSSRKDSAKVVSPVWLYPADGFLVASDRRDDPEGEAFAPAEDVVFPAIYGGTLRFLKLLPDARGGEALDLCGGSGIGALHFSRTSPRAATADLTERSALFAEFNGRLNQAPLTSLCGDLYAPVEGRQFDVISAHPPFVPATGHQMVYRDGGETGEEVTRRTVEGLPEHLRPRGTAVILCVARDTVEGPFEQRTRGWLGAAAAEFDVVFGLEKVLTVEEVVGSIRRRSEKLTDEQAGDLKARLESMGTRQFVYGALVVRRSPKPLSEAPLRVRLTPEGGAADFERLLTWRQRRREPGFTEWLANSRPHLTPQLQLTARHVVQDNELVPAEFVFSVEGGLPYALRPDGWVVPLVARFDGKRTVREALESARVADELPEGFSLEAFAGLVGTMIERALLEPEH